jgi:hypothetical protein
MKFVPAQFILHEKSDEYKGCQSKRKPENIDECKGFIPDEIPGCYFKNVF